MTRQLTILATGGAYFEAPRWRDGVWWTSDLYRKTIYTYTEEGKEETIFELEHQPSGLGWLPDGSLLFVSQQDQRVYRRTADGSVSLHADVSKFCNGDLNDMVVDAKGRAFVGEFGFDPFAGGPPKTANVIRIDLDGTSEIVASDLMFPNGSVITEDGSTLVVGEGMAGKYTAFTIEEDGSLSDRRDWATLSSPPNMNSFGELLAELDVIVDGCCMDAEGAIWAADVKNAKCIRVLPGGKIVDEIPAPQGQNIFACMLGGTDGRTLLLCVAPGLVDNDRTGDLAATLQTVRVDVPHAAFP
ncbi:SMP-30/gluconolactonase/LRE family protein [Rhodococcus qingshengii]|uniref:SMP-30/gluconolactonase/LRE family protein n=1 Tax=Rhodococcus qingshengii TaxID=334542 RepID=UPI0010A5BF1E|nr:SMP-30/gluconolactonase/LRE family protein [Rhodococcus qingshengii]THJ67684.1 SMP-30/gluconolactonase/LRE family protein [Rhodococcus qingshengii]